MKITVSDANILIDLADLDLLNAFTQLNFEIHTNDFIINEITDLRQKEKTEAIRRAGKLTVARTPAEDYTAIQALKIKNLSFADCAVLHYTRKIKGTLLTGDGHLRKTAQSLKIDVRGIFFIFDEMVAGNILSKATAREKLIKLSQINNRLPQKEIDKRIELWK